MGFLAQQPASVDHIAEVANQSENVLEADLPITPLVCRQQGERCFGLGWCCQELECQNVHVGSEIHHRYELPEEVPRRGHCLRRLWSELLQGLGVLVLAIER